MQKDWKNRDMSAPQQLVVDAILQW